MRDAPRNLGRRFVLRAPPWVLVPIKSRRRLPKPFNSSFANANKADLCRPPSSTGAHSLHGQPRPSKERNSVSTGSRPLGARSEASASSARTVTVLGDGLLRIESGTAIRCAQNDVIWWCPGAPSSAKRMRFVCCGPGRLCDPSRRPGACSTR